MSDAPDTSPWRSADEAPATEADPLAGEDIWVTAQHASEVTGQSEAWIDQQCRAGRLPHRRKTEDGQEILYVAMAATRDLAAGDAE